MKHSTGLPILSGGVAGRSGAGGHVATVFGAAGFLGRYVTQQLARTGAQTIVPYRNADNSRFLRPMGDLGRVVPMEWDLRRDDLTEECLRHSDVVINCVGRNWETRNFSYQDVFVDGPRRIARLAHQAGVSRFIHVSHINADAHSSSMMYRAKAAGELAVQDAFPGATIVRPSWLFGAEDDLLNTLATYPYLFRVNKQKTLNSPAHVHDVARAIFKLVDAESTIGKVVSLPGSRLYTFRELLELVEETTFRKLQGMNIPRLPLSIASNFTKYVSQVNADWVRRRYIDEKPAEEGSLSWDYLNMEPGSCVADCDERHAEDFSLEDLAIVYLRLYRPADRYERLITRGGRASLAKRLQLMLADTPLKREAYSVIR